MRNYRELSPADAADLLGRLEKQVAGLASEAEITNLHVEGTVNENFWTVVTMISMARSLVSASAGGTFPMSSSSCGHKAAVDAARLNRMIERAGVKNFKIERQCEKCRLEITLGNSYAELVPRIT